MKVTIGGLLRRTYNGLNKRLARILMPVWIKPRPPQVGDIVFFGEGEGIWPCIPAKLSPRAICYCIGVGDNATFDIGLAGLGFEVHSFDPTPVARQYAESIGLGRQGVKFHPMGVWNQDTALRFFAPSNEAYANYSVVDLHGTEKSVEVPCKRFETIRRELGHEHVDLIKLDVEGSWEPILSDLLAGTDLPSQLCVEFDSPTSLRKMLSMIRRLEQAGYRVAWFQGENFLFIRT